MKLIKSNVDLIKQGPGLEGVYKQIEQAGRTCYKSEDKITEDSAKAFVDRMITSGHLSMLEHGTVYLSAPFETHTAKYRNNEYSKVVDTAKDIMNNKSAVTTNYRVIIENGWEDDLKYLCEPTEYHVKRYTIKLTTNIGVTREGNRHRQSIAEESTRYCNYSKDKFDNEVSIVAPTWIPVDEYNRNKDYNMTTATNISKQYYNIPKSITDIDIYFSAIEYSALCYKLLLDKGWTPQQAREVLPLATKSDVVYTKFEDEWKHFFDLRLFGTTGKPHPNIEYCAALIYNKLVNNGILPNEEQVNIFCDNIIKRYE